MQKSGYELLYIVSSTKNDNEVKEIVSAVSEILAKGNAEVLRHEPWSKRRLEYKIRAIEHGTYILAYFTANEGVQDEIINALKLTPHLVRSIILKHNDIAAAMKAFFEYYEEVKNKNKRRTITQARYSQPRVADQIRRPISIQQEKSRAPELLKIDSVLSTQLSEDKTRVPETTEISAQFPKDADAQEDKPSKESSPSTVPVKEVGAHFGEPKEPEKSTEHPVAKRERKRSKKPTLEELDKKLEKILEGDIEL